MRKSQLILLLVAACYSLCQPALGQSHKGVPLDLDAGASPESGPDPLTPAPIDAPPLLAPGAAEALPAADATAEAEPVILAVRQRLAATSLPRESGERDDLAALKLFYATRAQPLWILKAELTPRAQEAIAEITQADTWGLKVSAFDVPKANVAANDEMGAESEIKLSLAVLKYARYARGGRLEPSAISHKFDQKPRLYEPGSLLLAIARPFVPWVHADDHPAEDRAARRYRVSMPASIEAFVRAQVPDAQRVELCHADDRIVVHRGWDPIVEGCIAGDGDRVIVLD